MDLDTELSKYEDFEKEVTILLNKLSMENLSNTPDFILAKFLTTALIAFNRRINDREQWYGRNNVGPVDTATD